MSRTHRLRPLAIIALTLAIGTLVGPVARAQESAEPTRIPLTYLKPSEFIRLLVESGSGPGETLVPATVHALSPDDVNGVLLVRASDADLKTLQTIVKLLDAPRATVRITAKLIRETPPADGKGDKKRDVVATGYADIASAQNGELVMVADGMIFRLSLMPRVMADGRIILSASTGFQQAIKTPDGKAVQLVDRSIKSTLALKAGDTRTLGGFQPDDNRSNAAAPRPTFSLDITALPAIPKTEKVARR